MDEVRHGSPSTQPSGKEESEVLLDDVKKDDSLDANLSKVSAGPLDTTMSASSHLSCESLEKCPSNVAANSNGQELKFPTGKDEGYGWVVVFAVFCINVTVAGYMKSFGLLYRPIKERFPDTSTTAVGLMMSLLSGCRGILAPVMGAFSVKVGPRVCTILGTLVTVTGMLLAVPLPSVIYLAFSVGGLVGVGICMCETPGYLIVSEYFQEKRATANGFRAAGNPFGGVVFPFLTILVIEIYPLQGAFLIISGVLLQMCILGMLLRPFETHVKIKEQDYLKSLQKNSDIVISEFMALKTTVENKAPPKKKPLDLKLLKNPAYIVYIINIMLGNIAIPNVLMYLPLFGSYKGLNSVENSALISFLSIFDFFCRLFLGWLSDKKIFAKRHGFVFGQVIAGISLLLLPLTSNLWTMLSVLWMRSLGIAFFWALVNSLLADQFGGESMATTWGFFRMTQGITNFLYPPLLGAVADAAGNMNAPFLLMGAMQLLGAITFALQPLIIRLTGVDVKLF